MFKEGEWVTIKTEPGTPRGIYNGSEGVIRKIFSFTDENPRDYYVQLGLNLRVAFAAWELVAATEAGSGMGDDKD